ncbi:MAG: phage terminase large subunit [Alphaproteobacteria bacterium]
MTTNRNVLNAALRRDLSSFIEYSFNLINAGETYERATYVAVLAWHLEQCATGEIKRLIINMPPRYLKSFCASVVFPAWILGNDPTRKVICVSYSQDLSEEHGANFRRLVTEAAFRRIFPGFQIAANRAAEVKTTCGGHRLNTSIGGTITGRGGNIIIIDDPMKPEDARSQSARNSAKSWFDNTLLSRLNSKRDDVIIVVMQRLHCDDMAAHLMAKGGWTVLNLPAIAPAPERIRFGRAVFQRRAGEALCPAREDLKVLEQLRSDMGSFNFEAQYMQQPIPEAGQFVKREWFATYDSKSKPTEFDQVIQSWDTAATPGAHNDYSACLTFGIANGNYYLLDVLRRQMDYPTLKRVVLQHAQDFRADLMLVENTTLGVPLVQELRARHDTWALAIRPRSDKLSRLTRCSPAIEAGKLYIPSEAPWLVDFLHELLTFPDGRYDDQVDALSQFLNYVTTRHYRYRVRGERPDWGPDDPARRTGPRRPGTRFPWAA